jgi:hypothetical protein
MAAAKRRAAKAARAAGTNPYIQRIVQDAELRDNIRDAFEQSRKAYTRLANGKAPTKALIEDKKLQKELREAAISLRDVGIALKEGPKRKRRRKRRLGRMILLGIVGAGLAIALSEGLRKKVLDALFGAEEEFDYTSTTTPAPAPETTAA